MFDLDSFSLELFGTFSIYQVLPEIIELWGLSVQIGEMDRF